MNSRLWMSTLRAGVRQPEPRQRTPLLTWTHGEAALADRLRPLSVRPSSSDFNKLAGDASLWWLGVGQWCVLLEVDGRSGFMSVARIVNRRDAYRD